MHDLHVWSLSAGKRSLSCHISCIDHHVVLQKATDICNKKFGITHSTIQVEPAGDCEKGCEHN